MEAGQPLKSTDDSDRKCDRHKVHQPAKLADIPCPCFVVNNPDNHEQASFKGRMVDQVEDGCHCCNPINIFIKIIVM